MNKRKVAANFIPHLTFEIITHKNIIYHVCFQQTCPYTEPRYVCFVGKRVTWHRPITLSQLLELKTKQPSAKIVVGNSEVGKSDKTV